MKRNVYRRTYGCARQEVIPCLSASPDGIRPERLGEDRFPLFFGQVLRPVALASRRPAPSLVRRTQGGRAAWPACQVHYRPSMSGTATDARSPADGTQRGTALLTDALDGDRAEPCRAFPQLLGLLVGL